MSRQQLNPQGGPLWLKRVLIPFWIVRIFFQVVLIGIYVFALAVAGREIKEELGAGSIALIVVYLLVLVLVFILDIVAIWKFSRGHLKPRTFLIFNVIQTAIWLVIFVLEIVDAVRGSRPSGTVVGAIVLLSYLALLLYASIVYHRDRQFTKRGQYAPAHNPAQPFNQPLNNLPMYNPPQQPIASHQETGTTAPGAYYGQAPTYSAHAFAAPQGEQYAPYGGAATEYYGGAQPQAYKGPPAGVAELGGTRYG